MTVEHYSFGAVRRTNMALALVGNPPIIVVDEPTTGVGPAARHKLWDIIRFVRKTGQTIVIASRNIEECETLCDRYEI